MTLRWHALALLGLCLIAAALSGARAADGSEASPLRVAVYDAAPYGTLEKSGLFSGVSVDLWRRVAEDRHWRYTMTLVPSMDDMLSGLEHGAFDAAIGAITITPERLERVDFSYPSHRSGVAVAFAKQTGMMSALEAYGRVASQLGVLVLTMLVLLLVTGALIWLFERHARGPDAISETAIGTLQDGLYWAVVTMTTVGYGDKTPKTHFGRAVAVAWMLGSLVLVSLLSTSIVAQLTAERLTGAAGVRSGDLIGKQLAAAASSSGAEYLETSGYSFEKFPSLVEALAALADHRVDAVVNSVGALDYAISNRFRSSLELQRGLLAPAFLGFALPRHSPLREPLDQALVRITTGPEWPAVEAAYFGH